MPLSWYYIPPISISQRIVGIMSNFFHDADPRTWNKNCRSVLPIAIQPDYNDVVDTLLQYNFSGYVCRLTQYHPIDFTTQYGQIDMLNRLLDHGISPARRCGVGWTALHHVTAEDGDLGVARTLLPRSYTDAADWRGNTHLHETVKTAYVDVVRLLIKHRADDSKDPLHLAISLGDCEVRRLVTEMLRRVGPEKDSMRVRDHFN